ncbi:MAG: SinI family restriction endonuclease [Coriobacteriaceae bacterium]|nr:SinI family restriction endonuclease [Coriobacteriaceae bacterium]
MASKAQKEEIKRKLQTSINYCNSHHMPVQPLFEELVESIMGNTAIATRDQRIREMKALFPILQAEETKGFIPSISLNAQQVDLDPRSFLELWLSKWIGKYATAWRALPSARDASPKGAATDPALIRMVLAHAGDEDRAIEWACHHNLFMSAENVGGNLLEEYIASKIEHFGWIWCRGEILTAIDFCNTDCTQMFQVKNKSNTENSSGKGFREDRGASKWFRMKAERRNGQIITYWSNLVELVRSGATTGGQVPNDLLNEHDYLDFVEQVARKHPEIITDREGNL